MTVNTFQNLAGFFVLLVVGGILGAMQYAAIRKEHQEHEAYEQRMQENAKHILAQQKLKDPFPREQREGLNAVNETSKAFLNEILAGNFETAYQMTTPAFQKKMTQEQFAEFVRANPEIHDPNKCIVFGGATLSKGSMVGAQIRNTSPGAKATVSLDIQIELHQKRWLVSDFTIKPRTQP